MICNLSANPSYKGKLPAKPSPKLFLSMTRQQRLDGNCSFSLASRIRGKSRVHIGSYDHCLRISDKKLRETCIRWRRGIWGAVLGISCPGCLSPFRPSHAKKCNLFPSGSGGINDSDVSAFRTRWRQSGVSNAVLEGVGVIEFAFESKNLSLLRTLFGILAGILNIDWCGEGFVDASESDDD